MFKPLDRGIFKETASPLYGSQDVGISPAGAMDLFALETGNALLGNPPDSPALEFIYPPAFALEESGYFILTGAGFNRTRIKGAKGYRQVRHGEVTWVIKGEILEPGTPDYGFRGYLCYRVAAEGDIALRKRPSFEKLSPWRDPQGYIRVLPGSEHQFLSNPGLFLKEGWTITPDLSDMGMRIACGAGDLALEMEGNMISEAVADGTVQLTPKGPIILLKHRQTVGGYPRIFNVISADVDILAQYAAGQVLHFKQVDTEEARTAVRLKKEIVERLRRGK